MPYRPLAVLVIVAAAALPAWALPAVGARLPAVEVDDVGAGRPRALPADHPVLVLYEDREAQSQNQRARALLGRVNDEAANRARLEFVAVADVAAWSWWPARRAVLSDLKTIARKHNTTVYADWHAALRRGWGLTAHRSALVLAGADGRVQFAAEGPLSEQQLQLLRRTLQALGCTVPE